jgi:hypothetical protein
MTRSARARRAGERGSFTLWLLGLCLMLLALGGLAVDLGRGFSERRALYSAADSAALAGAGAIDEDEYRATGEVVLVPELAEQMARADLARQLDVRSLRGVDVRADRRHVEVEVHGEVELSLLRVLDEEPLWVQVRATAVAGRSS